MMDEADEVHEAVRVDATSHPDIAEEASPRGAALRAGGVMWTCTCDRFHVTTKRGIDQHVRYENSLDLEGSWKPLDGEHGGRLGWQGRYHRQMAGPWKPEGCEYGADRSFDWNSVLVYRRDGGRCQACGAKVMPKASALRRGEKLPWKDDGGVRKGQVQHIIPKIELAKRQGLYASLQEERKWRREEYRLVGSRRRGKAADPAWYLALGNCPHNLVLLCDECHKETFVNKRGFIPFSGLPGEPLRRRKEGRLDA